MSKSNPQSKKIKSPWPTKEAMEQVYAMKLWGENKSLFYSGEGSHDPEIVIPYIKAITTFLRSFKRPLIVCDLGCGDFNVGKQLVKHTASYIAVDIVLELIKYNSIKFQQERLQFQCLDIAMDDLPAGDCIILRQVLQHLSNPEIQQIIPKLNRFKYVILTEHLPNGNFIPNQDIISGQGTRLKKQSGLLLTESPFHFKVKKHTELLSKMVSPKKGIIVTTLFEVY